MSAEDADWALLGIAPTGERRDIRRAYAQKLKAIDPETDPKAFIKLRNAYERVLAGTHDPNAVPTLDERAPPFLAREPEPVEAQAPEPAETEAGDESEKHARAILALLWNGDDAQPWLAPDAQAALLSHWQAMISDPRMESLDHADRVERWASAVIAETSPLSIPILLPAAERFGWVDADHNVHSSDQISEIARRYRMLKLLDAASRPGTRHHSAWVELHRPAGEGYSKPVHPYLVFEVIAAMRYANPQLGEGFDPDRLATWEMHADDARTAHQWRVEPTPPSCVVYILTFLVLGLFAFGLVHLVMWISPE